MAHNVEVTVKGTKVIVTMDIGPAAQRAATPSASGKTRLVATTSGSAKITDDISLSLNLMQKAGM